MAVVAVFNQKAAWENHHLAQPDRRTWRAAAGFRWASTDPQAHLTLASGVKRTQQQRNRLRLL